MPPKTTKRGKPKADELPRPLRKSSGKAQRTWAKAHDSAVESYGEGERAHRVAYSALKHQFEKKDDRWVKKDRKGPSDPRARDPEARRRSGQRDRTRTFGGVDVIGNSKPELYERARRLDVEGRSRMSKEELADAIARRGG